MQPSCDQHWYSWQSSFSSDCEHTNLLGCLLFHNVCVSVACNSKPYISCFFFFFNTTSSPKHFVSLQSTETSGRVKGRQRRRKVQKQARTASRCTDTGAADFSLYFPTAFFLSSSQSLPPCLFHFLLPWCKACFSIEGKVWSVPALCAFLLPVVYRCSLRTICGPVVPPSTSCYTLNLAACLL